MKNVLGRMTILLAAVVLLADDSLGAVQYWDTSAGSGYQHGNGAWSTAAGDTNWTAAGVAPMTPWVNANDAEFSAFGGASTVTLNTSLTSATFKVKGSVYTIIITNGGRLYATGAASIGTSSTGNVVRVQGSNSLWNVGAQAVTVGSGAGAMLNALVIDGQGVTGAAVVSNTATLLVGSSSSYNSLMITNGGLLAANGAVNVGSGGWSNQLSIIGDASATSVLNGGNQIITVGGANGTNNVLLVDGQGTLGAAMITNASQLNFGTGTNGTVGNLIRFVNGGVGYIGSATIAMPGTTLGAAILYPAYDNSFEILDGARVYSVGIVAVAYSGKANTHSMARNRLLVRGSESLLALNGSTLMVGGDVTGGIGISNNECRIDGGLVTNVGAVQLAYNPNASPVINGGSLTITNGGRLYSTGASIVSVTTPSTGNVITVTGASSLWKLGNQSLTIGFSTTSSSNLLVIDQGGLVDDISTLSVLTNNSVNLLGGTLGVATWTLNNGSAFIAGDGAQAATLKSLGGTLSFNAGLIINTNATLTGIGTVSGGAAGVLITNGATLNPGSNGVGSLTISGSSLTLGTSGVYRCEITDMKLGPGVGWDLVNVSSQLVLAAGTVIKMDSKGALATNFEANKNYNLRIATYGSLAGVNPATLTVNTNDFKNGGVWTLTNTANALWLICRDASALPAADYTWNAPTNGNWDAGANWAGASVPPVGGGTSLKVAFGDTGVAYRSTNNLGGAFQLNQLRFSGRSGVTNFLSGNQLALTNTGARVDYMAGETGSFTVSNAVRLTTDTEFGGEAYGGTLTLAGPVTNLGTLTKRGAWTLALRNAYNNIVGPIVVDGPDGMLRVDHASGLAGVGWVTVSNGLVVITAAASPYTFSGSWGNNRRALVTGVGSVWTNNSQFIISDGATNVQLIVDGGSFYAPTLTMFQNGSRDGSIIVTNGGLLNNGTSGNSSILGNNSTNCLLHLTGANSSIYRNQALGVASGVGTGNRIIIEKKALIWGANSFVLHVAGIANSFLVADGGLVQCGSASVSVPGLGGLNVLGSNSSVMVTGSGSMVSIRSGTTICYVGKGSDYGNTMTISSNAVVSNLNLQVAQGLASQNQLIVTNGGKVYADTVVNQFIANGTGVLANAVGNMATITGGDSLWDMKGCSLTVCQGTGTVNGLLVQNGGLVTNLLTLIVAAGSGASNNNVTVDNGTLVAGTITCNNALPNSVIVTNGGALTATTFLYVTNNPDFKVSLNGGTLNVKSTLVDNGAVFVAGDGSLVNTLNLLPGGTNTFVKGLVITNGTTLSGSGLIQATATVYGVLSPGGVGVGTVTNRGLFALANGASSRFELAANTTPGAGWDLLAVTNGALNLGGALVPVLKGGFLPAAADRFLIMTNQGPEAVSGDFANGSRATIYAEDLTTKLGTFKIEKGAQGVVLTDYQIMRSSGSLIFIR